MSNEQLQAQLDAMYASTSWKITAPLRLIGTAVRVSKEFMRQALASPRAFVRRLILDAGRRLAPAIRSSPGMMRLIARFRDRYPDVWSRISQGLRPRLVVAANPDAQPFAVESADAWDTASSPAERFRRMLAQELQHRKNKKSEH